MQRSCLAIMAVLCSLLLCACGDSSGRQAVSGAVSFQGKPLSRGMVEFCKPSKDNTQAVNSAVIVDGEYRIPEEHGLLPGNYSVKIQAAVGPEAGMAVGPPGTPSPDGKKKPSTTPRLPPKYNTQTTLTAEVTEGGVNVFNYDL